MKSNAKVESWFAAELDCASASVATVPMKAQLLPEAQLRTAITTKGTIAVVRVTDAQTRAEGMGHERVFIEAAIERMIFGRTVLHLEMSRTGRYPGVVRGQRYIVAVTGSGELINYVVVPNDLDRALEGHRKLVERLVLGR